MGRNAVGRAFRITEKDARSYDRVSKPRSKKMRPNPMGVTTLATINGRGAYASARSGAQGQTRAQRLARARKLIGGKGMQSNARGHRAAFISAMRKNPKPKKAAASGTVDQRRRGRRVAAYKSALKKNKSKAAAARSALRSVPFTSNERKRGTSFAGVKARKAYRRNRDTVAEQKRYEEGYERIYGKKGNGKKKDPKRVAAGKKAAATRKRKAAKKSGKGKKVATTKKRKTSAKRKTTKKRKSAKRRRPTQYKTVKTTGKRKTRVAYGPYKRARLYNPRTGKVEYSYMYRTKGGRLRRIPTRAVAGWGERGKGSGERATRMAAKVQAARRKAADRILKHGDAFVPNKKTKKRKTKKRKSGGKKVARKTKRKSAKRVAAGKKAARTRKRKAAAKKSKRKTKRKSKRKSTKKRKSAKRVAAGKKAARTRKRKSGGKRKASKRKTKGRRKARRLTKGRYYVANRRRRGGRRMRKNAFMANLKAVLKTGALVFVGYASHRVLTSLACEYLFTPYVVAPEGKEPNAALKTWEKPICGAVVGLAGVGALSYMSDKRMLKGETAMAIGGGMMASLVQYVVVSALAQFDQPKAASYLSGYSNSMAYSLRGNRRRAMRGMGAMQSIMPRYTPIGEYFTGAGQYEQAAAGVGSFEQAAAGVGEYFVPQGTQGVGQYEPAGPLAMQAAAGTGQIEDGIRPDSNLDRVLDLAESAAGLGEYITATPGGGGWDESRVPTQSQWIPNGPLWAGELRVKDTMATSELPAGVLATVGGNGILSG